MEVRFNIDLEKIKELNTEEKSEALFKYLKNVSKNKTPIVLSGRKKGEAWDCILYECTVPASMFNGIKLPATNDKHIEDTEICLLLTDKLLTQFVPDTEFIFKDSEINIKRGSARVRDSYNTTQQSTEEQLQEFSNIIHTDVSNNVKASLELSKGSEILGLLKELRNSPESSIYITKDTLTLRNDTVFLRTKNNEIFNSTNTDLYINMYIATKLLNVLDYCETVKLIETNTYLIVIGYSKSGAELVRNVSSIFEADFENPSDEDLASITPTAENGNVVDVAMVKFIEDIENQRNLLNTFIASKALEAKLYKNGNGISLGFETISADKTIVTFNVGEVTVEEPTEDNFTEYSVVLPLSILKDVAADNQSLRIIFDDSEDTAVLFESGEFKILSGKLL